MSQTGLFDMQLTRMVREVVDVVVADKWSVRGGRWLGSADSSPADVVKTPVCGGFGVFRSI